MDSKSKEAAVTKARKELRDDLLAIAPIYDEKPFFMSEEFTLVDCCVAPILWRLVPMDIKLPEKQTRGMHKYMQSIFERDSFRASLTEAELEMHE